MSNVPNVLLALGSAALLLLAFPSFNQPWAAWVALVPWLILLRSASWRQAFRWSWGIGFAFFLGSLWWLINLRPFAGAMAFAAWFALCAYLALYFAVFGVLVWRFSTQHTAHSAQRFLVTPALWVSLECARTHLFSGFGWNLLGYSQAPWLPIIQFADLTGVWGVSFLIVLVNVSLTGVLMGDKRQATSDKWGVRRVALALTAVGLALGYGVWRTAPLTSLPVRVAVLQGNVPQQEKWDEIYKDDILARYESLTRIAAESQPQLIIWPETSAPGYLGLDEPLTQRLFELATRVQIPLLIGAPMARLEGGVWKSTNSAALIGPEGRLVDQYDKLHLVPFGEFIPLDRPLPWLRKILPPIGEFVPGREFTVFETPVTFSVLICFEDIFPDLARRFVRAGARLLVVITNDAWFGPTAAAYQHTQASIFRAVELRTPVVRAANTGWSGCIDPSGRIVGSVRHASGTELFVEGTTSCSLPIGGTTTLYARWGDWFAWACVLFAIVATVRRRAV